MIASTCHNCVVIHRGFLDYWFADNLAVDLLRYLTVLLATYTIAAGWWYFRRVQRADRTPLHISMVISNTLVALFILVQESQQIGKPFLAWRLPCLVLILISIWLQIRFARKERDDVIQVRHDRVG